MENRQKQVDMNKNLRLVLVFFVAFSLAVISGPISSNFHLPDLGLAHADRQFCQVIGSSGACSEFWYPAGPAMNNVTTPIFTDGTTEYVDLQSISPTIDFTDSPCTGTPSSGLCGSLALNPCCLVTAPVAETAYYEIDFHLGNHFWNCDFSFGNSACGIEIRQAFAHMFDRGSFCTNSVIAGVCTPIDNPVPTSSGGGLPSPNPCAYDSRFAQSGVNCVVGSPGGTAYHLAASTGANGTPWIFAPGSTDLNAADTHIVAAGVATGFSTTTSILTGAVATITPTFFIRTDDPARKQLGESLAAQICYVFTGLYTQPCLPFLNTVEGPITGFPGYTTSKISLNQNWWMYTAGFSGINFFDDSLYFTYNSRFVSGIPSIQPPSGPCSPQAVPTSSAADFMYLCSPNYDNLSNQMENSPCLTAPGDPALNQPNNGPGGHCISDPTKLSAISAGVQAEATFGAGAFTLPLFEKTVQFGYLNGWTRAINHAGVGLPNHFTWLNAYNPNPHDTGTLRQAFSQTTRSTNPFIGSSDWDKYIIGDIYDTLLIENPLNPSQRINWMVYTVVQQDNATVLAQSGYEPPPGSFSTFHFFLRNDVYFQDGRPVTAYDVAFSYLNMVGSGATLSTGASTMSGVTILGPRAFDIAVKSVGPFTLPNLTGIYIVPGRYWTGAGSSAFDSAVAACTGSTACAKAQFALSGPTVTCPAGIQPGCASFDASNMQIDPTKISATYDPIANHILLGSGPWQCGLVTRTGSGTCSSSGVQNPPQPGGSYGLTRFGKGNAPGSHLPSTYSRSSGTLALWIWSQENDISPIQAVSAISACFGLPVNPTGPCAHWQQGIGGIVGGAPSPVDIIGVSIVERFYNFNWISPYEWATSPPLGIAVATPVLYEGPVTLNPASLVGCPGGYDC